MRRTVLIALALAACRSAAPPPAAPAPAPAPAPVVESELTTTLNEVRTALKVPAVAAAVWRDGKLVDEAAVGTRRANDADKVTTDDRWHLGSNTKAMTGALIAIYVDRGTLHWTDTIGEVLGGNVDAGYKDITLDQLLRHESGAPAEPPGAIWRQLWTDGDALNARTTFVRALIATPPAQAAGTYVYSNASFMIAGAMLEAKTGKRWEDLIRADLWTPLGMTSCGFGAPVGAQPRGHDASGAPVEGPHGDNPPGLGPAGTAHCSLKDYGKFLSMFATGAPALISPASMQHLLAPSPTGHYAGGWIVASTPQGPMLAHSGSNTFWYATAVVLPDKHFAFVIATNKAERKIESYIPELLRRYLK